MAHHPKPRLSILSACVGMTLLIAAADLSAQGTSSGSTSGGTSATGSSTGSAGAMKSGSGAALSSEDKNFANKAAIGGLAEVEMGKLAQQKAASDQVKQFGSRMVDDHSKANDELKQVASAKGITLPTELDAKHKSKMDKLQKLSGAQFDRAYMDDMVADHKEDVSEFQKQSSSGKDSDLKGFASKTLPTLQEHLKMAQSTQAAVKNGGKTSASAGRNSGSGG
jgi:putative membrane protein